MGRGGTYSSTGQGGADESLFGSSAKKTAGPSLKPHQLPANAIVVSRSDIKTIKERSIVRSQLDLTREAEAKEAARQAKQKAATDRKERMLKLEEDAKKKAKKSELEVEKAARNEAIRQMAEKELDENLDLVKLLNTLGARASAFTIRDEQLKEKGKRAGTEKEYDERMDKLMEIDRLRDLAKREQDEEIRRAKRIEDRQVIIEQIAAREKQKLLYEESREQENQAMLALIQKYKEEDVEAQKKRAEEVRLTRIEVFEANKSAIERKEIAKQREKDEEEAILLYQAQKDEEMRKREEEENEKARLMKERQAKLLAMQEKTQNKQAEIDELRARRYAEERERERERKEVSDKHSRMIELQSARASQAEQKKAMMAREAVMQQQEYEDAVTYSLQTMEREKAESDAKHSKAEAHRDALKHQIATNEIAMKRASGNKFDEGKKLKDEFAAERAKLEAIRDKMVHDMEKKGINPRYLTEMKMADIQKMQMR